MGTSRSAAELAGKFDKLADLTGEANKAAVNKCAFTLKKAALSTLGAAIGGDLTMSGLRGGKGGKLGVRYNIKGTVNPTALVTAVGPWQLVERRTRPHLVASKYVRVAGRGGKAIKAGRARRLNAVDAGSDLADRRAVMRLPDGGFRKYVVHPGTRGKYPWRRSVQATRAPMVETFRKAHNEALLTVFK